jgi:hypothetical protein
MEQRVQSILSQMILDEKLNYSFTYNIEIADRFRLLGAIIFMNSFHAS